MRILIFTFCMVDNFKNEVRFQSQAWLPLFLACLVVYLPSYIILNEFKFLQLVLRQGMEREAVMSSAREDLW